MTEPQRVEWRDVEIPARGSGYHVVIENGVVVDIATGRTPAMAARAREGQGAAVVPALYDHHHHITAAVARQWSCDITDCADAQSAFARMESARLDRSPLRVVGYDEAVHGVWTCATLDKITARPLKVQHRSGHMWVLNSPALARLPAGRARPDDGRFYDEDPRLAAPRAAWAQMKAGIATHVAALHAKGVSGCTDMSPHLSSGDWAQIQRALPRDFAAVAAGDPDKGLARSKLIIAERDLPDLDALQALAARLSMRELVAVHAVTYEALVLALVGLGALGEKLRIEHAFLANDDMIALAAATGASIGVQPGFIQSQGDRLLRELDPAARCDYQPLRRLHAAGLRLFGGTDAPFAPADPWLAMQAAVARRTAGGQVLNHAQALSPNQAFALFTRRGLCGEATAPDLCLGQDDGVIMLDRAWADACADLAKVTVKACAFAGHTPR